MKKLSKYLVFVLLVFLISCINKSDSVKIPTNLYIENFPITIYVIDSCEYLGYIRNNGNFLTHKGNCSFCIERNKKNR